MKYRVVLKGNPQQPAAPKKKYAGAVNAGKFTLKHFAKEISGRSSLTAGDVENVLTNFVEVLPTFLKLGLSIKLGDFGTLRLTLSSEGVDEDKEFTASHIKGTRVVFTPGPEFKESLKQMSFEEEK
ncbi:MAG: HU family DNA-binding protein [Tannerella sp.]|jgi:predicted histone-like DNA-binding protein|nr:HU family DNA-binding protein [Tannerella sp.]